MRGPEPLSDSHQLAQFNCTRPSLNSWLIERALANEHNGASRCFVVCQGEGKRVIGYYCLAQGAIGHDEVSSKLRKNMPNPLPVTILGRLAIDQEFAGQGLGRALLKDAILRAKAAAQIAASRGVLVQALDEEAANFYLKFGFLRSPTKPMYLMLSLHA